MAKNYLEQQGLIYVASNFLCRRGEIDLIMKDRYQLIFVEVRYRSRSNYGTAADTITCKKQRRIMFAAQYYLHKYQLTEKVSCRFDIVAVDTSAISVKNNFFSKSFDSKNDRIKWIKDAFNTDSVMW